MNRNRKSVWNVAGAGALALLMTSTTSVFATPAQRGNNDRRPEITQSNNRNDNRNQGHSYRDNERVNVTGNVTSFTKEKDGYRVHLDRGRDSYWIPSGRIGNRNSDLRIGVNLVLGGIFRGGRIDVDAVSWPGDRGRRDDFVRGIVERVDVRGGTLLLRESSTRRTIEVDMRETRRSSRIDLGDLRRGDSITLAGNWERGGMFDANRIESFDRGRR